MDWADEEAEKVGLKLHWEHKSDCVKIASALRAAELRGRVAGMREAAMIANHRAAICEDAVHEIEAGRLYPSLDRSRTLATENCARLEASHIAELIEAAASKLSPTT